MKDEFQFGVFLSHRSKMRISVHRGQVTPLEQVDSLINRCLYTEDDMGYHAPSAKKSTDTFSGLIATPPEASVTASDGAFSSSMTVHAPAGNS